MNVNTILVYTYWDTNMYLRTTNTVNLYHPKSEKFILECITSTIEMVVKKLNQLLHENSPVQIEFSSLN